MESFLEDLSMAKVGELKIGCTQTPAKYVMPALIGKFKETYPGIKIILDQGSNSAEMVQSILHHENELAIMRYRPDVKRLKIRMIGSEEVLLIAAKKSRHLPGDEISITQLPDLPLIMTKEGSGIRDVLFEYFRKFRVVPKISMESGSIDLIKEMVRRDGGVGFMGKFAAEEELEKGLFRSVRILEGAPKIDFGIGYLQKKYLSPAAWSFLRVVDKAEEILPALK
jgi:DNA-binding transcriptional LysR family regulator